MTEPIEVTVDAGAPPAEMEALRALFEQAGFEADVRDNYMRLSAGDLPWLVMVTAPFSTFVTAFAVSLGTNAGSDTWTAFREGGWRGARALLTGTTTARGSSDGTITVRDPDGPNVDLRSGIPDEALRELAELDWPAMRSGRLGWSEEHGWVYMDGRGTGPAPRRP